MAAARRRRETVKALTACRLLQLPAASLGLSDAAMAHEYAVEKLPSVPLFDGVDDHSMAEIQRRAHSVTSPVGRMRPVGPMGTHRPRNPPPLRRAPQAGQLP